MDECQYWSDEVKKCLKVVDSIYNMMLQHAGRSNRVFLDAAQRCRRAEIWAVKKVCR